MSCGVGCRRSSDPTLLWLWRRPAATAPIRPLAWEPPYAVGVALEMAKRQKKKENQEKGIGDLWHKTASPYDALCHSKNTFNASPSISDQDCFMFSECQPSISVPRHTHQALQSQKSMGSKGLWPISVFLIPLFPRDPLAPLPQGQLLYVQSLSVKSSDGL